MMKLQHAIELGATLYVPATHNKLWEIAQGMLYPELKSMVICLEDAVLEQDLERALLNLKQFLLKTQFADVQHPVHVFIRPRNTEIAEKVLASQLNRSFCGFVLPKFTLHTAQTWQQILPAELQYMPTLETAEYFDTGYLLETKQYLQQEFVPVLCLRIGANDLLSCLHLRRPKHVTVYDTPIAQLMQQILGMFIPAGFQLSAPVFEHIEQPELLEKELELDTLHGLLTKTAIHPTQVRLIHQAYRVRHDELADAEQILQHDAKSVFKSNGSMLEPATHRNWAQRIVLRAQHYGVIPAPHEPAFATLKII
ncbi:HpcH/HpaI aldolase/citrate lyase family protein [Acinetobacter brisouii]|uniref:HpcH/HpaI aldolase/citrate lyase family protein n=1 Tax=Acinetobacter brisouii TaxID=396323 RepID=UPI0012500A95|nr:HpcH/HpaI aldolase/citrate lyase family protein [Acinetobacter brisouii]